MSSFSPKVPIPVPHQGLLHNVNPRVVGPAGLTRAMNWIFRDGEFRVRDGMLPLGALTNPENLFVKDEVLQPYSAAYSNTPPNSPNLAFSSVTGNTGGAAFGGVNDPARDSARDEL